MSEALLLKGGGGGVGSDELTATAANVLSGSKYVGSDTNDEAGTGTMTNNGAVSKSFTPSTSAQSYTIPKGYHNGSGKVSVAAIPSTYIAASTANFFKNGTLGGLYTRGVVARVPKGLTTPLYQASLSTNISFTWSGEWYTNNSRTYVLPTISTSNISDNVLSIEMNRNVSSSPDSDESPYTHAITIRKTVDFTTIKQIKMVLATSGAYEMYMCFWVLNPTTKNGIYYCLGASFNKQWSGTYYIDVSSLSGQCLFGWFRYGNYGTKGNILKVTEISLLQ